MKTSKPLRPNGKRANRNLCSFAVGIVLQIFCHSLQPQQTICAQELTDPLSTQPAVEANTTLETSVETEQTTIDGINFAYPKGIKLEKIAAEPLVRWPIAADWGQDHSLLVLESNWNGETVQQQLQSKPHRIIRLLDQNHDGRFDKRELVASDLSFSAGLLLHQDSIYVSSPPSILKLTDPDGDGFFDQRETWYDGGTLTYCANDLHGPFLGPDGWIYWTKGAFAEQQYELLTGKNLTSKAAHLLRRHPDGGPVDILMSGGMDNPVDVTFLPNGERIFCSTFMHHPGDGLRDGIGHAIYGSLFGKPHNPIDNHPRTGPLFDPIEELGPAAPASVMHLTSDQFTKSIPFFPSSNSLSYDIISCQFNLQKLAIHRLTPSGGTFNSRSETLLSADRVDFHPVDCLEDHDGSLIVLDTGGWYDLCCPSSGTAGQIAPGGIYRLSLKSPSSNTRPTPSSSSAVAKVWDAAIRLTRVPGDQVAREEVLKSLSDKDEAACQAALNVVSLHRWPEARQSLLAMLSPDSNVSIHTTRLAIECLGRIGDSDEEIVQTLLSLLDTKIADRTLRHAILYALIELECTPTLRHALTSESANSQKAALLVLDQKKQILPADVDSIFRLVFSDDATVGKQAVDVLAVNAQLADASLPYVSQIWGGSATETLTPLSALLTAWYAEEPVEILVGQWLAEWSHANDQQKQILTNAVASRRGNAIPESWLAPLQEIILASDADAVELASALEDISWTQPRDQSLADALIQLASDNRLDLTARLKLLTALPQHSTSLSDNLFAPIISGLSSQDIDTSNACIGSLAKLQLTENQSQQVLNALERVPATRLQSIVLSLLAIPKASFRKVDSNFETDLLAKISSLPTLGSLDPAPILAALQNRPQAVQQAWRHQFAGLQTPPEDIEQAVEDFLATLPVGDAVEGYQVFRGQKASCSGCHQIGYVGGRIGPELTRIGRSRSKQQLAEAILYPSARQEQSYRATRILTTDGRVFSGLPMSLTSTHLELITGIDETKLIRLDEIERREPSPTSLMPTGLDKTLSPQEFADLLAFLLSSR